MISDSQKQLLKAKYNPEGSILRQIQLGALDALVEFDLVCKKNNIQYWLDSGSLLGAVRHGGFIPWDDDIDICVRRQDYNRLLKCLRHDLNGNFKLHDGRKSSAKNSVNPVPISRVLNYNVMVSRKKDKDGNPIYEPVWVDIFPVENGTFAIKRFVENTYGKFLRRKVYMIQDGKFKHLLSVIMEPISLPFFSLLRLYGRLFHSQTYINDYGINLDYRRYKQDIFPLSECVFEGIVFPCPGNVNGYLTTIYGDYTQIPPEEKRITHKFFDVKASY